jgi:hypothetical protein
VNDRAARTWWHHPWIDSGRGPRSRSRTVRSQATRVRRWAGVGQEVPTARRSDAGGIAASRGTRSQSVSRSVTSSSRPASGSSTPAHSTRALSTDGTLRDRVPRRGAAVGHAMPPTDSSTRAPDRPVSRPGTSA